MGLRTVSTAIVASTSLVVAVGAGFALGRADEPRDVSTRDPQLALANADLTSAASCADLLQSYVDRGLDLVGPYGWSFGGGVVYDEMFTGSSAGDLARSVEAPAAAGVQTSRSINNESGTNVQEAGVDEPDVVKVSGSLLARLDGTTLRLYDVSGDKPDELASLSLPRRSGVRFEGQAPAEMLLVDGRVVVLQGDQSDPETVVTTVDLSDPTSPQVVDTTTIAGRLSAARLHGDVVRVVVQSDLPELDFRYPGNRRGDKAAQVHNEQVVRDSTLADWLPTTDGEPLVDCDAVAIPADYAELGTTTVVAMDPADPTARTVTAVAAGTLTSYFSPDRFYLATDPYGSPVPRDCWGSCSLPWNGDGGPGGTTRLYAFALDGANTTYVASGQVEGIIQDRWSMDAVAGSLRLAVGPSTETGNFNSLVTMREDGSKLVEAGRVDKLGVNEDIKSVRWFDDLAIVVTFRQTDPLYAVDLSSTESPRLLGELKIPGFSEYLHPLGKQRLVGIGQDASLRGVTRGAQAALFDVTDLTAPRQLDVVRYPKGSTAGAATDPRQFTWLPERRTVLTVVSQGWTGRIGWVSVLSLEDGAMTKKMVEVEYGSDVAQVRLVPLASGKVVLVTGDDVSFFDF